MKPIELSIQALGPFAAKETIDFSRLEDSLIFLVHGRTGSGKSTIMDAICYALYGSTSGLERTVEEMSSHWAQSELRTTVEFLFKTGDKTYRAVRHPRQNIKKKRGEGFTEKNAEAYLYSLDDGEEKILEKSVKKVTAKIEDILGFTGDQFRQVIMLPQGKFRQVLSDTSDGREEILKTLFGTVLYQRIEEKLKKKAWECKGEIDGLDSRKRLILEQTGEEDAEGAGERLKSLTEEVKGVEKDIAAARRKGKALSAEISKARLDMSLLDERDDALREQKELLARKDEMERKEQTLGAYRKALGLADIYNALGELREKTKGRKREFEGLQKMLEKAEEEHREKEEAFRDTGGLNKRKEEILAEVSRLEFHEGSVFELKGIEKKIAVDKKGADSSREKIDAFEKAIEINEKKMEERRSSLEEAKIAKASLGSCRSVIDTLERLIGSREELKKKEGELRAMDEKIKALQPDLERAESALKKAQQDFGRLEESWKNGQRAILARDLEEGVPCPVCGSPDHPAPAGGDGEVPRGGDLEKAKERVLSLEKEVYNVRQGLSVAENDKKNLSERTREIEELLSSDSAYGHLESAGALKAQKAKEEKAFREKEKLASLAPSLEESLKELTEERDRQKSLLKKENDALNFHEKEKVSAEKVREEILKKVPADLRDTPSLQQKIKDLRKEGEDISTAIEKLAREKEEAGQALTRQKQAAVSAEGEIKEEEKLLSRREEEFVNRLRNSGFESVDEYRRCLLGEEEAEEMEQALDLFKERMAAAGERVNRTGEKAKDIIRPDIALLERKEEELSNEIDGLVGREKERAAAITSLKDALSRLKDLSGEMDKKMKEYAVLQDVADIAAGRGRNTARVPFHRYVLGAILEEVLEAATRRLLVMSGNRYRLYRSREAGDKRRTYGLDLNIFDEYTGQERPVSTLSGGEGFMASLALALGLADVVQRHAGGIHLDTMFIDEGFGSLDAESLDVAMDAIEGLLGSGRLVGLISHVEYLKERVPARLEVVKGLRGSSTKVHV